MEIELKFRVTDPDAFARLLALTRLDRYTLHPAAEVEQQRNTYYDTADGLLRAAHHGMRIREIGDRAIVTLKGPNQGRDGLHQRAEWEVEAASPDPETWPPGPARTQALALLGGAPLLPLLTIQTSRHHIYVADAERDIAEISLDEGVFVTAAQPTPFCELEIELLPGGAPADLDALVDALQEHIVLVPEPLSKLERGLALLNLLPERSPDH